MSLERNKDIARRLIVASGKHDGSAFAALLSEKATYWVQGDPKLFPPAGEKTRAEICAYMASPSIFVDIEQSFGAITAEDDRVALEVTFRGTLPDGRVYTNTFHYLIFIEEDRVTHVKEYLDSYPAAAFFGL